MIASGRGVAAEVVDARDVWGHHHLGEGGVEGHAEVGVHLRHAVRLVDALRAGALGRGREVLRHGQAQYHHIFCPPSSVSREVEHITEAVEGGGGVGGVQVAEQVAVAGGGVAAQGLVRNQRFIQIEL